MFPLLTSSLCRKEMKHFVVEKLLECKWKICFSGIAIRCKQCQLLVMILTVGDSLLLILSCQNNSFKVCNCFTSKT